MIQEQVAQKIAGVGVATAGGATLFGFSMAEVNEYLQAAAFLVAIISGTAAAIYYFTHRKK